MWVFQGLSNDYLISARGLQHYPGVIAMVDEQRANLFRTKWLWAWGGEYTEASVSFNTSTPLLAFPLATGQFTANKYACNYQVVCVLLQKKIDKTLRLVGFWLSSLTTRLDAVRQDTEWMSGPHMVLANVENLSWRHLLNRRNWSSGVDIDIGSRGEFWTPCTIASATEGVCLWCNQYASSISHESRRVFMDARNKECQCR